MRREPESIKREINKIDKFLLKAIARDKLPRRWIVQTDDEIDGTQIIKIGKDGKPYFPDYPIRVEKEIGVIPPELWREYISSKHDEEHECQCQVCRKVYSQIEVVTQSYEIPFDERSVTSNLTVLPFYQEIRRKQELERELASLQSVSFESVVKDCKERGIFGVDGIAAELNKIDELKDEHWLQKQRKETRNVSMDWVEAASRRRPKTRRRFERKISKMKV